MEGQFATVEVRDAALYAVALGTPQEAETLACQVFLVPALGDRDQANGKADGPVARRT